MPVRTWVFVGMLIAGAACGILWGIGFGIEQLYKYCDRFVKVEPQNNDGNTMFYQSYKNELKLCWAYARFV